MLFIHNTLKTAYSVAGVPESRAAGTACSQWEVLGIELLVRQVVFSTESAPETLLSVLLDIGPCLEFLDHYCNSIFFFQF